MTSKEALDILKNSISTLALNHKIGNRDIANLEIKDIVTGIETWVIPIFEKAITPQSADEVCNALSEFYSVNELTKFKYDEEDTYFYEIESRDIVVRLDGVLLKCFKPLPLSLFTLIVRFYEGEFK